MRSMHVVCLRRFHQVATVCARYNSCVSFCSVLSCMRWQQEQGRQSPLQQLQLLMSSLRHESIAVRHVALGEVRSFLLQHKSFIADTQAGLLTCSTRPALQGPNGGHSAAAAALSAAAAAAAAAAAGGGGVGGGSKAGAGGGGGGSKAGGGGGSGEAKLSPVQCQDVFSELLAALMASCENLGRDSLAASMKQRY